MPKQIQSLERGLFILEAIMFSKSPVSSSELAERLGVHKSTVSHLTTTLIEHGYLRKESGSARLSPGPSIFSLARAAAMTAEILEIARPYIEKLAATTGESSHMCELRGEKVLFLVNAASRLTLRVEAQPGSIEPAHSTAVGKALLSGISNEEIEALFNNIELERYTDTTITDLNMLLAEIGLVRKRGFAMDIEEQTAGTGCIAAPVHGVFGNVVAAVGLSGPVARVFAEGVSLESAVMDCSRRIEKDIVKYCAQRTKR